MFRFEVCVRVGSASVVLLLSVPLLAGFFFFFWNSVIG